MRPLPAALACMRTHRPSIASVRQVCDSHRTHIAAPGDNRNSAYPRFEPRLAHLNGKSATQARKDFQRLLDRVELLAHMRRRTLRRRRQRRMGDQATQERDRQTRRLRRSSRHHSTLAARVCMGEVHGHAQATSAAELNPGGATSIWGANRLATRSASVPTIGVENATMPFVRRWMRALMALGAALGTTTHNILISGDEPRSPSMHWARIRVQRTGVRTSQSTLGIVMCMST